MQVGIILVIGVVVFLIIFGLMVDSFTLDSIDTYAPGANLTANGYNESYTWIEHFGIFLHHVPIFIFYNDTCNCIVYSLEWNNQSTENVIVNKSFTGSYWLSDGHEIKLVDGKPLVYS